MFRGKDPTRNAFMQTGSFARKGYDWWWHSLTAKNERTGEEKAFFFEFFTCNPALGGSEPVLGQLPEHKRNKAAPSYLMVKAGCWGEDHCQLHRFFGWDEVKIHGSAPFSVKAGDCYVSDTELRGRVVLAKDEVDAHPEYMCDAGSIEWDLTISKIIPFNVGYGASKLFRDIKAFEMYWHAEGMKTLYAGQIIYNGERYIVDPQSSFGYADKNWGRGFTSPWVWLSSCDLMSKKTGKKLNDSAFDIGGGKPKVYFVPLNRKLLSLFCYEGENFEFNFSKFWTLTRTKFACRETETQIIWHVRQETTKAVMDTRIHCRKKDMLLVNYEAPDGSKRHNHLWNGGNGEGTVRLYRKKFGRLELVDEVYAQHVGCEYGEYDR